MARGRRIELEPAFLLHQRAWRDSSRIVEFFSRDHGRIALFAKGVRRSGSGLVALLQPFVPLLVSWSGNADGGTLIGADLATTPVALPAPRLMSGFYLNELLLKLLAREDPHPDVFEAYGLALDGLRTLDDERRTLRVFEKRLLEATGFGLDYAHELATGERVEAGRDYHVDPGHGVRGLAAHRDAPGTYAGADLLSLAAEDLRSESAQGAARRLLGAVIDAALDGRELSSRRVARAVFTRPPTAKDE